MGLQKKAYEKCWTPDNEEAEEFTVGHSRCSQMERKRIATSENTLLISLPVIVFVVHGFCSNSAVLIVSVRLDFPWNELKSIHDKYLQKLKLISYLNK